MKAVFVCDDNKVYSEFWEPQAKFMFHRYGLHSVLYYITSAKEHSLFTSDFAKVVLIQVEPGIPKLIQALLAKWYFPAVEKTDEPQFICDIDCFILSREFVKMISEQKTLFHLKQYGDEGVPGYYVYGKPIELYNFFQINGDSFKDFCIKVMNSKSLTNLTEKDGVSQFSKDASPDWKYFCTEERYAYQCMLQYTGPIANTFPHPQPGENRICRSQNSQYSKVKLMSGQYIDYHCPRPFHTYYPVIMNILNQV